MLKLVDWYSLLSNANSERGVLKDKRSLSKPRTDILVHMKGNLKMLDIGVSEILSNQERGKRIDRGHLFPPRPPPCLLATHSSKIFTLDEMWTD